MCTSRQKVSDPTVPREPSPYHPRRPTSFLEGSRVNRGLAPSTGSEVHPTPAVPALA